MNTQMVAPARAGGTETPGPARLVPAPDAPDGAIRRLKPANRERRGRRTARRHAYVRVARVSFGF